MSRKMQGFVFSLIVWFFSVTGADGKLTRKPDNNAIMWASVAAFHCSSDAKAPVWKTQDFTDPQTDRSKVFINESCTWPKDDTIVPVKSEPGTLPYSCDVYHKFYQSEKTLKFSCTDGTETASANFIFLDALKCGIHDNQYACIMDSSAYKNATGPVNPYISSLLTWKDDGGNVVAQTYANTQDRRTVLNTEIPSSPSKDSPYVCSVEYKMEGDLTPEYSSVVTGPIDRIQCPFPVTAAQQVDAEAAAEAAAAKANATSDAKLERDGVEAIAMLMSLMAAFLVL